ncbi:MAG: hypothetical protein AB7H43_10715 [Acidimicrobiia bacterium]
MTVRLLVSPEKLTVAWLRASTDVGALCGDRIGTELYGGSTAVVWLTQVTGEERVRRHLTAHQLDVRSYAPSKGDAETLALTVHDVLHQMPGVHALGIVNDVRCLTLPTWLPDTTFEPVRARYIGSYEIAAHPALS